MVRLNRQGIAVLAERVGKDADLYSATSSTNVTDLVHQLGGKIELSYGDESLSIEKDGSFTIYVPFSTSPMRDNFTIAHELGHYYLHHRYPKEVLNRQPENRFNRGGYGNEEAEANIFAANLLMPEQLFRESFGNKAGDILGIAREFGVSPAAVRVRASFLALL